MATDPHNTLQRRDFLKLASAAAALGVSDTLLAASGKTIAVVLDSSNATASGAPVKRAAERLRKALSDKGVTCTIAATVSDAHGSSLVVVVTGEQSPIAESFPALAAPLDAPESIRLAPGKLAGTPAILVSAQDTRGFVYGLLELAERVQFSTDSSFGLNMKEPMVETSPNKVRCIARAFCSAIEDKSWYYSKDFWRSYLDAMVASRFNRFAFVFGFGYDFPKGVTGDYFHFPYPYLLNVPGYKVSVEPLAIGERARNLEMLKFISSETAARGLEFQLGIWTHAYEWTDSPKSDHHIIGLTPETHAAYSRDALAMLLKECPEISGLTMRVHGESGVPEGSYPFWTTLFEAISGAGRAIEIDMHAKGINQIMIDMAAFTGMPVKVSAKSWAEHMGLGYHQADIRELEIPRPDRMETGIFNVSNGARRFTRYGYADLYQEPRKYDVLYRLWPGTQRHLLLGDPELAAAYGRTASFCGAAGLEICEPLTFKGREGSGEPGGRCAYVDASLNPKDSDWEKFEYTYLLWGRMLYNPDTKPEVWRRYLKKDFGLASESIESSIANASRVLALVTTTHLPSASNHSFWPEMYDNMPIVMGSERPPYSDTPEPRVFGSVSPLDPQLFSSLVEHVHDLMTGSANPKYSPAEVAQWLEDFTAVSSRSLALARKESTKKNTAEFRRMEEDILIQIGLGQFFAAKMRSGMLYEIYAQTGNPEAGRQALAAYQKARTAWSTMAERAKSVYMSDVSYGSIFQRRGHWLDRIPGIDKDVTAMQATLADGSVKPSGDSSHVGAAIRAVAMKPRRPASVCSHTSPTTFTPGQPLSLSLQLTGGAMPSTVELYYRHVNQGERWKSMPMEKKAQTYEAAILGGLHQIAISAAVLLRTREGQQRVVLSGLQRDVVQSALLCHLQTHVVRASVRPQPSAIPDRPAVARHRILKQFLRRNCSFQNCAGSSVHLLILSRASRPSASHGKAHARAARYWKVQPWSRAAPASATAEAVRLSINSYVGPWGKAWHAVFYPLQEWANLQHASAFNTFDVSKRVNTNSVGRDSFAGSAKRSVYVPTHGYYVLYLEPTSNEVRVSIGGQVLIDHDGARESKGQGFVVPLRRGVYCFEVDF